MTSHFWTQRTWSYFTSHTSLKATTALSTWGIRRAGSGPVELSRARQVPPVHLDRVSASLGKWSSHSRGSGLGKLTTFHPSRSCASPTADTLPYILSTFLPTLHLQCQRRKIIGNFLVVIAIAKLSKLIHCPTSFHILAMSKAEKWYETGNFLISNYHCKTSEVAVTLDNSVIQFYISLWASAVTEV